MDGISYLLQAMPSGIKTPLTDQYVAEILARTGAGSLEESLQSLRSKLDPVEQRRPSSPQIVQ